MDGKQKRERDKLRNKHTQASVHPITGIPGTQKKQKGRSADVGLLLTS